MDQTPVTFSSSLHLVDPENLAGDPFACREMVLASLSRYRQLAAHAEGDLAFVAANRWLVEDVAFDLPFPARVHTASGPDGADRRLLADAPEEWVCRRFSRLVIGSGDHLFAGLAATALRAGLWVTVVARPRSVSRAYFDLGCEVVTLDGRRTPPAPFSTAIPLEAA